MTCCPCDDYAFYIVVNTTKEPVDDKENAVIYSYLDTTIRDTVYNESADSRMWTLRDMYVSRDEYIQDIIVNTSFQRFADNVMLMLHALNGRIKVIEDENGYLTFVREDLRIEEIDKINLDIKNTVFVGINEIVSADVINRCADRLYDYMDRVLAFISRWE